MMSERRITSERDNPLKTIAGLIQKLSYRDMQKLSEALVQAFAGENKGSMEMASALLKVADQTLAPTVNENVIGYHKDKAIGGPFR
jgi:hypothetical protein